MDTTRYVIALLVVVTLPPSLLLWFLIHPFASAWRKIGPGWTYAVVSVPAIGLGAAIYAARDVLLAVDYGISYPLVGLAVILAVVTAWIAVRRRKHLTFGILAGIPELRSSEAISDDGSDNAISDGTAPDAGGSGNPASGDPGPGLLTEGIYSRVRHPRYVEVVTGVLAYALFANYLAGYVVWLITIPALYAIVVLEERELVERFGEEYEEYRERVPRFIPRLR